MAKKMNITINTRYNTFRSMRFLAEDCFSVDWDEVLEKNRMKIEKPKFDIIILDYLETNKPLLSYKYIGDMTWVSPDSKKIIKININQN